MSCPRRGCALSGKIVVLTRRREDAAELARALEAHGAQVRLVPSFATTLLPPSAWAPQMATLSQASCVAFCSRQGVHALQEALRHGPWAIPQVAALWAVGPATQAAAQALCGRFVHAQPPYTAEGMALALLKVLRPGCDNVVLPAALHGRLHVAKRLLQAGIEVLRLPLYQTQPLASARPVLDKDVYYVVFTSPSGVTGWLLGGAHPPQARCISIGPTTSKALEQAGLTVCVQAKTPGTEGLVAAILEQET